MTARLPAILALDPGGTTGWCYYDPNMQLKLDNVARGQISDQNHYKKLFDFLIDVAEKRVTAPLHIITERFEFRKEDQERDKIEYISAEYNGVVKLFGQMYRDSGVKIILQSASQVKGTKINPAFWTDDKLKKLALWIPGQRHAMDATRHYLYYRTFTLKDNALLYKLR